MPHYKDGRMAFCGDVVRGIGYNVKDKHDKPVVLVGTVIGLKPGQETCNIQIAYLKIEEIDVPSSFTVHGVLGYGPNGDKPELNKKKIAAHVSVEYGACDQFELVQGVTVPCRIEGKWQHVRPWMSGIELMLACKAGGCGSYALFRSRTNKYWEDEHLALGDVYEILEGDNFYAVPPATF